MSTGRTFPAGDYVSPGLAVVAPDEAFPHLRIGDKAQCTWPYLNKAHPHNWYVDDRFPVIGFLDRDEAMLIHNIALTCKGRRGLEIGSWRGWSSCHIALAGVTLDSIDPVFIMPEHFQDVTSVQTNAGVGDLITLHSGRSPEKVHELARERDEHWAFIFVDGEHDGTAPLDDTRTAAGYAADDAVIVFHDLMAPDVAAALDYLRSTGWKTLVYQTMQIMGVAWRGNLTPPHHVPDPSAAFELPTHLASYRVSGETPEASSERFARVLDQLALGPDFRTEYQTLVKELKALCTSTTDSRTAYDDLKTIARRVLRHQT